jgi:serine phosphatase RsbU (regulator of sigma subunit)
VITVPPLAPPSPLSAALPDGVAALSAPSPNYARDRRLDSDLAAARQVQRALLPSLEAHVPGVEVAAEYRPAYEIGGDFYEMATRPAGRLSFVVGDVAGKGVTAALIMARVSSEARHFVTAGRKPSRVLAGVNRWLNGQGLSDRFVTATAIELDVEHGVWTGANAGHPPALLFRRDGRLVLLGERGGPGMGFGGLARWRCPDEVVPAEPDDLLLVMTDGLADRIAVSELATLVAAVPGADGLPAQFLAELKRRVFERLAAVSGEPDDATLLAVRVSAAALGGRC